MSEEKENAELRMIYGKLEGELDLRNVRICTYCKQEFSLVEVDEPDTFYEMNEYKVKLGLGTIRNFAFCSMNHLFSWLLDMGGEFEFPHDPDEKVGKK